MSAEAIRKVFGRNFRIGFLFVLTWILSASAQEAPTPWRNDPLSQRLAAALEPVRAIDTHTHLLEKGNFNPARATQGPPLLNRSTHPWFPSIFKARYGITLDQRDWAANAEAIATARAAMIKRLGEHGFWMDHLDHANVEIALVNQVGGKALMESASGGCHMQAICCIRYLASGYPESRPK
jgi:hypothetical protein